ncbi:putative secreted protein (Por secretion system target) [Winogradskyella wandonensis]|uniref:Putative secreted protein (Por secretion system target) n=1 Tax=Winogradskyella wandonensis TaxID=1442586 RepID=A0A4R1KUU1_9FLAO|nr:endonuclease [Winogradskyella wandonensis]TCK68904.1 putative secreted protein (Por secretion system target) [Winogradskyella wandonensis]
MKKFYLLLLFFSCLITAQQPYYDSIDFTGLTGDNLKNSLAQLIDNASTTYTYGDVRDDFKFMELDPDDTTNNNVLLLYGYVNDISCTTSPLTSDRRIRNKNDFGGLSCDYNREHVFARSNANPGMGPTDNSFTGIVADPHNLRPADRDRNSTRSNRKFADATGNSRVLPSGDWYPGDEWKGDVARIMMYMYTRYGERCLPELNASGAKQGTTDMLQILLQWNVDDPVSDIEDNRNNFLEGVYLNRNPFIDNPALATAIWGGPDAEDRWGNILSVSNFRQPKVKIYPNPVSGNEVSIISTKDIVLEIYDVLGKKVKQQNLTSNQKKINISGLKKGIYLLRLKSDTGTITKKLVRQ